MVIDGGESRMSEASAPQPPDPARALRTVLDGAIFPLRLRGYDHVLVDRLLDELRTLTDELPMVEPSAPALRAVPTPTPPPAPAPAPAPEASDTPSFRRVPFGWSPKQVTAYLQQHRAVPVADEASSDADVIDLRTNPGPLIEDDATAAADAPRAAPDAAIPQDEAPDRWADLGQHAAAVMAAAEAEAQSIVAQARRDADQLVLDEVVLARAATDQRLATARAELAEAEATLAEARARLAALHESVGELLVPPLR